MEKDIYKLYADNWESRSGKWIPGGEWEKDSHL